MNAKQRRKHNRINGNLSEYKQNCCEVIYMLGLSKYIKGALLTHDNASITAKELIDIINKMNKDIEGIPSLKEVISKLKLNIKE